jgi:predicted metal-dependent peptidase
MQNTSEGKMRPPSSDESIEAWASKYPEIASIVETIATKKAEEKFSKADERLKEIDKITAQANRTKSEDEIRAMHSDFDELRKSDSFHSWAEEQPKWVQDALYENQDDPQSVVRVIDLYKVDNGMDTKAKRRSTKEAASEVKSRRTTRLDAEDASGKIKESDVQRMTPQQYEANADAIMESIRSGKFVYDISGAAR